jgi:putative ABC transport system permease protein
MLTLKDITKVYSEGDTKVEALRGISLEFGDSEFAAILGPSGCGKTTLLNIIGGLDQYTTGDLIIRGKSTKQFKEHDWDTYRNHSVGFVFQSYNLIPHQTVLANVELALTLSGVSREERRRRAAEALEKVGLGDQMKKKPNQMSGGQMQRVAIARALVNDPEILLADEPTGALDSETSVQVMDLLREISRDRLVIMVTHNPDLAKEYATRTIRLLDGRVISDTAEETRAESGKDRQTLTGAKTSMSFLTALNLSLNNLLTKKGRTILTAFAGSIGIIGIALILSLSNGVNRYIERVQRDTLSSYPLEIDERTVDMTETMNGLLDLDRSEKPREEGKVYSGGRMTQLMSAWMNGIAENDLEAFKAWLEAPETGIGKYVSAIQYEYNTPLTVYRTDTEAPVQVNPSTTMEATGMMDMVNMAGMGSGIQSTMMNTTMRRMNVFNPLLDNEELLKSQYTVLAGRMPEKKDEVVLILNSRNELSDYALYTLGLKDQSELRDQFQKLMAGEGIESEDMEFTYEELMGLQFKVLVNTDVFEKKGGLWVDRSGDAEFIRKKLEDAMQLTIVGILRPAEGSVATSSSGGIGYRRELMDDLLEKVNQSEIAQEQLANPGTDVFTGQPFISGTQDALSLLDSMEVSEFLTMLEEKGLIPKGMIPEAYRPLLTKDLLKQFVGKGTMMIGGSSLEGNLEKMGVSDPDKPAAVYIYPKDFESKKKITALIDGYNKAAGEDKAVHYTDYVGLMMDSVTTIVDAISYVLVAFVSISLVVSSIMIGIITYISVLERTKEIGILRAIGASRRDVSRVFNAETLIVGFAAGVMGILVTLGLTVIANIILGNLTGIPDIAALPPLAGVILVGISMALTLIAGIIPSRIASRKDPVVALRTE